jgi:hypothetical protein
VSRPEPAKRFQLPFMLLALWSGDAVEQTFQRGVASCWCSVGVTVTSVPWWIIHGDAAGHAAVIDPRGRVMIRWPLKRWG